MPSTDLSTPTTLYWWVQLVCQRSWQGAPRGQWFLPWQEAERSPGALTNQPAGRSRGVPQPRSGASQGMKPLPAHRALLRNTTGTLNPSI